MYQIYVDEYDSIKVSSKITYHPEFLKIPKILQKKLVNNEIC